MAEAQVHLVVGTPCFGGQVTSAYFTSMLKLQEACHQEVMGLTFLMPGGDALITRARQNIVTYFLEDPTATHLLFIDADIGFEPEQVFRLLRFHEDVTAALYPLKRIDWARVKSLILAGNSQVESASLSYVCEWKKPGYLRDGFSKALYVGTGFLMIRRSALLKMMEHYPQLRYSTLNQPDDPFRGSRFRYAFFDCILDEKTRIYLPEDYSFCRRWTDMGGDIWVDTQSRLDHLGSMVFHGDIARKGGTSTGQAAK
jgi:hypothetical protein